MTSQTAKDNAELTSLQDAFLSAPTAENWTAYWVKCQKVALSIVELECVKKHLTFNLPYKKILADDAVLRLFERYKKYRDNGTIYRLKKPVTGLYYVVQWSMYSDWRQRQQEDMSIDVLKMTAKFESITKINKRRRKRVRSKQTQTTHQRDT